jgi:hypothetical protein
LKKFIATKIALFLLMTVFLVSCSSYVRVKETWRAPEAPAKSYKKLLVIGITYHPQLRKELENIFSETLSDHGVAAVASHTLIDDLSKAEHTQIQAFAQQAGADAVIITRVLSKSEHANYQLATGHLEYRVVAETTTTANSSTTVAMSGVGFVPGEMDAEGATLQTRFFDVSNGTMIWSAMSHAAGSDNDQVDVCWKLSALLTQALSKDHLIEINDREFHQPSL